MPNFSHITSKFLTVGTYGTVSSWTLPYVITDCRKLRNMLQCHKVHKMLREYRSVDSKVQLQIHNNDSKMTSLDYLFFLQKNRLKTYTFHDAHGRYKITNHSLIKNTLFSFSHILWMRGGPISTLPTSWTTDTITPYQNIKGTHVTCNLYRVTELLFQSSNPHAMPPLSELWRFIKWYLTHGYPSAFHSESWPVQISVGIQNNLTEFFVIFLSLSRQGTQYHASFRILFNSLRTIK